MKQKASTPRIAAVRAKSAGRQHALKQTPSVPQSTGGTRPVLNDKRRREELARLLPLWPKELADLSLAGRRRIIRTLERALRTERKRGRDGHWAYDLARHAALIATWRSECASLRVLELTLTGRKQKGPPQGEPKY